MQAAQPLSRRGHLRVQRSVVRVLQIEDQQCFPFRNHRARVNNLCLGGIGLTMQCAAAKGDRLTLVVADSRGNRAMRLHAIVRWHNGERFGLKWIDLLPEQQAWLASLVRFWAGESAVRPERAGAADVSHRTHQAR